MCRCRENGKQNGSYHLKVEGLRVWGQKGNAGPMRNWLGC